jgi:exodeoxyribonuclease-3
MTQKIISYNVNGLRAALNKGFLEWLAAENPDIICLQETKIQEGQVDTSIFEKLGYYHYWHYAVKKGYSGVALLTKEKPVSVSHGVGMQKYDDEGRTIIAHYKNVSVLSVYHPSGSSGDHRQAYKMEWLSDFLKFANELKKSYPNLIISGDYNICHKPIDINFPKKHETYSGFLPEERAWFDSFVDSGFVDSFREFNKEANQYSWWSYRANARDKNLGWRIDYNMVTEPLRKALKHATILQQVKHSDHCPVVVEVDF